MVKGWGLTLEAESLLYQVLLVLYNYNSNTLFLRRKSRCWIEQKILNACIFFLFSGLGQVGVTHQLEGDSC